MNIGYCEWTTQNYSVEYRRVVQNSVRTEYPRYLPDSPLYYPAQHDEKAESRALNAQHNGPLHQNQHHTRKDTATPHPEQNPSHPTPIQSTVTATTYLRRPRNIDYSSNARDLHRPTSPVLVLSITSKAASAAARSASPPLNRCGRHL